MKKLSNNLLPLLFLAAVVAGCGSSSPAKSGTGGSSGGSGGTSGGGGVDLVPDNTGWIDGTSNSLMVQGAWYGYGDAYGDMSCGGKKCTDPAHGNHQPSECSMIMSPPVPAQTGVGFPNTGGKMCTMGSAAKVIPIINPSEGTGMDYSNVWGAGIGFDLAAAKGAAECDKKGVFNATSNHVTGVQFDIDALPPGLRVEFPIPATDGTKNGSDYWNGNASYGPSPVVMGTNVITWDKVTAPGSMNLIPFDPTMIESIQFHVPAGSSAAVPYQFCISNVKLLTQ